MTRWWAPDSPAERMGNVHAVARDPEPPPTPLPLAPTELVADVLERLHGKEPELVVELIGALAKCEATDMVAIFGGPRSPSAPPGGGRGGFRHVDAEQPVAPVDGCGEIPNIDAEPAIKAAPR
jgi:hypothetical protein